MRQRHRRVFIDEKVDEILDTSDSSDKHICSLACADRKPLFGSFIVLPTEQRGNSPWIPDNEEPVD